jgi:hypothetical protein
MKDIEWDLDDARGFGWVDGNVRLGTGLTFSEIGKSASNNNRIMAEGWTHTVMETMFDFQYCWQFLTKCNGSHRLVLQAGVLVEGMVHLQAGLVSMFALVLHITTPEGMGGGGGG